MGSPSHVTTDIGDDARGGAKHGSQFLRGLVAATFFDRGDLIRLEVLGVFHRTFLRSAQTTTKQTIAAVITSHAAAMACQKSAFAPSIYAPVESPRSRRGFGVQFDFLGAHGSICSSVEICSSVRSEIRGCRQPVARKMRIARGREGVLDFAKIMLA